ncbi:hypothetical protein AB4Z48_04420 [Cupriavidus sp. 2TAF22]|uniref:hypothetical protein n=1 Tax=unclassified Cupriavidus TaxID=2640874 RepID=UPI003F8DB6EE
MNNHETPEITFPPADPKADFERQCALLDERSDFSRLPDIRYAMYPGDLWFSDDLSDGALFNERYLEPDMRGEVNFYMYLATGIFNFALFTVLVMLPLSGEIESGLELLFALLNCIPFGLFTWGFLWMGSGPGTRVRFNRQAQLVHVTTYDKGVVSLRWRDVRPYVLFGNDYRLRLCFPVPYGQLSHWTPITFRRLFLKWPQMIGGHFDDSDAASFGSCIERLEFIRRYMEHGFDAVQPHPEAVASGLARKPSGFPPERNRLLPKWLSPSRWAYWFAAGPLVDRWLAREARQFQWPEEVEQLCAPGADLSDYDTTPVKSRTTVYYRYAGMGKGIVFVDRNGKEIRLAGRSS